MSGASELRDDVREAGYVGAEEAGGNVYDKYASQNPIERRLVANFMRRLDALVELTGASRAHEVGCGEGEIAIRLARRGLAMRGTDAFPEVIEQARRRAGAEGLQIEFEAKPVQTLDPAEDSAELVLCCEVLEHLENPDGALDVLASLADPWLIVSVPREPLWRALNMARGKYLGQGGNTPGHLGHWSRRGFASFLDKRFEVEVLRSPTPWTMALCRARP